MLGNYGRELTQVQTKKLGKYIMNMALQIPFPKKEDLCNCGYYDGIHLPITNNPSCEEFSENKLDEVDEHSYNYTKTQMNPDDDHSRIEFERANIHAQTGVWL